MKIILLFVFAINLIFSSSFNIVNDGTRLIKCGTSTSKLDELNLIAKAGKLSNVTQKFLTLSKIDNIQNLMSLAVKEERVSFIDQCRYISKFKALDNGDKLLLKCLKNSACDLENFSNLMTKSSLHVKIASKYPNMSLGKINIKVGIINENIMNKYFQSTGWTKIEGEIGRNGIDGLFIKKKNGVISDVLIVESKYNKSGLQYTNHGQQMTKQWIGQKIDDLIKKYPNNSDYKMIKKYVDNDIYRAMLWNLKIKDDKLMIDLKHVHDKMGKAITSDIKGNKKMKINYSGNQEIDLKNPHDDFHKQIVSWYKEEI